MKERIFQALLIIALLWTLGWFLSYLFIEDNHKFLEIFILGAAAIVIISAVQFIVIGTWSPLAIFAIIAIAVGLKVINTEPAESTESTKECVFEKLIKKPKISYRSWVPGEVTKSIESLEVYGIATCNDKTIIMDLFCNGEYAKRQSVDIYNDKSFRYSFEMFGRNKCDKPTVNVIIQN